MRARVLGSLSVLVPLLAASGLHAQQQAQFLMPMLDVNGAPVETFAPEDLAIFEDGKAAKVLKVERKERPLRVTLALDNGRSMAENLVHVRAVAKEFFEALPEGTEAALMTTAPQPRFAVKPTKDRAALLKAIDRLAPDSSPGRFIEAVQDVASSWKKPSRESAYVLVALGSAFAAEYINKRHLEEAFAQLKDSNAVVHVVMVKPAGAFDGDAQVEIGQRVARETRGRYEDIGSYLQLGVLSEIAKDVAKSAEGQFLLTIERPAGASGPLGNLSLSPANGLKPGRITRIP